MLSKVLRNHSKSLIAQQNRAISQITGKHYVTPEGVEDIVKHLDHNRPKYSLLYFSASWNPQCAKIENDYEKLTHKYAQFHHVKVDCDATPQVKLFFDARVEPQFLVLVNGSEIQRIVGYNFEKIGSALEQVQDLHQRDLTYFGNSKDTWERFYDEFDRWSKIGEYDRDAMRN